MRTSIVLPALILSFAAGLAPTASASSSAAQKKGWHQDERYGFQFRTPRDWDAIPVQMGEGWIVAKYLSDRMYTWTEEDGSWTWEHRPDLQVIAFVDQELKTRVKKEKNKIIIDNPYKDYQDYMRRTYSKGGWHVSSEEEDEQDGVKVTKMEIKVDKLARRGPKRIVTWIFHAPNVDFAVQFEVLENHFDKLDKLVRRTLSSFELIPRTAGGLPASTTGSGAIIIENVDKTLTPEERRKERMEQNRRDHAKVKEHLPDGWSTKKFGRCLVVTNSDMKFARRVTDQANAILDWLDDNMGYIGPDAYVREPIIRILDKAEQESAFHGNTWWNSREIVIYKSYGGWEQSEVNSEVVNMWFQDRDHDLYAGMPQWLRTGLLEAFDYAKAKGRRLEFRTDGWERDDLREAGRDGRLETPRNLMLAGTEETFTQDYWTKRDEFAALVRFMLTDRKLKQNRGLMERYITNLRDVIRAKLDEKEDLAQDEDFEPATEEEEERLFKEIRNRWKAEEKDILEQAWSRTFADWDQRDWERFEKAYFKSI